MRTTVTVNDYIHVLQTWSKFVRLSNEEIVWLTEFYTCVRSRFDSGEVYKVADLCAYAEDCGISDSLRLAAHKSCLLGRLLYAGEKVRTKPCPEHQGHWSGCVPYACEHGCSFGSNLTGWI